MQAIRFFLATGLLMFAGVLQAVPTIKHWTAADGVPVYFIPTEGLPIIDAKILIDAGSARDGVQLGLASLTGALLTQGAAGMNAQEIAQGLEGVGAKLSVATSRDSTSITFRSLTDKGILDTSWGLFKTVLTKPDFPVKDIERLKKQTLLSIKARGESPATLAQLALYKEIYGSDPYANPIQGQKESVEKIASSDIKRFYQQFYSKQNVTLVLVGNVSIEKAEKLANDLLKGLANGDKPSVLEPVKDRASVKSVLHQEYPSAQTHLMYGLPSMLLNDPDYFALYVGNHILGGSGFTSRIVKEIREERGLAYSAYSYFRPMLRKGTFIMGLQTRNEKAQEAAAAVKETLKTFIEQGPTEAELKAAKLNIVGGFALRLDSNKKLLANLASMVNAGVSLDYLNTFSAQVEQVSVKQIKAAFQKRIQLDKMVMVTVGQKIMAEAE